MTDFSFAGRVEIDRRKLTGYLLSTAHPVGRSKARFFASLGFFPADADRLDQALRALAAKPADVEAQDTRFGTKYIGWRADRAPRAGGRPDRLDPGARI